MKMSLVYVKNKRWLEQGRKADTRSTGTKGYGYRLMQGFVRAEKEFEFYSK